MKELDGIERKDVMRVPHNDAPILRNDAVNADVPPLSVAERFRVRDYFNCFA